MDFGYTEKQQKLRNCVRIFCRKEFNSDTAMELDKGEKFPIELYRKAAKHRFSSMFIPEKYGGDGQGYLEACLTMEEMCRADSSLGLACMIGTFGSDILLSQGTEEQKLKYLPRLCRGDAISAAAFTEPAGGTDIKTINTKAEKHGNDSWLINGNKTLITNAPIANFFIVLCQTGRKNKPHKNQSLFIVDRQAEGVTVTKLCNKMGIRCIPTGRISFKDVRVNDDRLLGEENHGFEHCIDFFNVSRTMIAAQAVGTAQGAIDIAIRYGKKRQSKEQPIIQFQQVGARLAEMTANIEAARQLTYKAAWSIDQNNVDPMSTSMAKLCASAVAIEATDAAIQTLGGYGYLSRYKVERAYRDARVTEIYEGTSEIQRLVILKHLVKAY